MQPNVRRHLLHIKRVSFLPYYRFDVSSLFKDAQNALMLAGSDPLGLLTPFIGSILCFSDPAKSNRASLVRDAAGCDPEKLLTPCT